MSYLQNDQVTMDTLTPYSISTQVPPDQLRVPERGAGPLRRGRGRLRAGLPPHPGRHPQGRPGLRVAI